MGLSLVDINNYLSISFKNAEKKKLIQTQLELKAREEEEMVQNYQAKSLSQKKEERKEAEQPEERVRRVEENQEANQVMNQEANQLFSMIEASSS